ncbi:AAA family ATPase [Candidatus Woesearchaeota archaeon]|nr:AAA family ATPase [Candidatus Woesearchaeota archaeon]
MIIIVTGTPGTGKTSLAKAIAKKLKMTYLDVNTVIQDYKLREKYERKRQTYVVDEKKLSKILIKLIKVHKDLIIDSHLSHFIPKKHVDICIITKTDLKVLKKRLEKRKYNKAKVKENLDAEIFEICHTEAQDQGHNIILVDTTKNSINKCLSLLKDEINENKR